MGLIRLNRVGWAAVVALGSIVSVVAAVWLPLPLALAVGVVIAFGSYSVEWLFTWRGVQTRIDGFADLEAAAAAAQELGRHGIKAWPVANPDGDAHPEGGAAQVLLAARHRRPALRLLRAADLQ